MPSTIPKKEIVQSHFDDLADKYDILKARNSYYYTHLKSFVQKIVRPNSRVLEIGCATGEILAHTNPSYGVGIDLSSKMIERSLEKFPNLHFVHSSIEDFKTDEKFDYIILVDVLSHVFDITDVFERINEFCHPTTKIIVTTISPWWDPILSFAEKLDLKTTEGPHNYVEIKNIKKIVELLNFSVSYSGYLLLAPVYIPLLSYIFNTIGIRTIGLRRFAPVQYLIIQPKEEVTTNLGLGCSVIIPCHNEEGNIENAVRRIPRMGQRTEIIVVNDGSTDGTADKVRALQGEFPDLRLIDYSPNQGKGNAVKKGFDAAEEEVIMILDADLSVAPEELPRFFDPLNKGLCQFVNGTRMVYPMESMAMRTANFFGNKLFSKIMSFITNQDLSDTLCGTKALYKKDYKVMKMGLDKWGDYDLLFGAAKMGNKIMEVTVHYKDRASGESKMKTLRHGCHLLKACFQGFRELVFTPRHNLPTKSDRIKNEIDHGKLIKEESKGELWYWTSPAGKIRMHKRCHMLSDHITENMNVLEIGCGLGYLTKQLAKTNATITAIDISPELLEKARKDIPSEKITFKTENAYQLSYPDNHFDTVVGSSILHHLDVDQALKEFMRVLKPGGSIYFTEPNYLNPQIFLERKVPFLRQIQLVSPDETAFVKWPLQKKLKSFGYTDIQVDPFDFLHPATPKTIVQSVNKLGEVLEKTPLLRHIAGSVYIHASKQK